LRYSSSLPPHSPRTSLFLPPNTPDSTSAPAISPTSAARLTHPVTATAWHELQTMAAQKTQIAVEVDALRYLLDRDPDLGRRTVARTVALLQSVDPEKFADSRKPGRLMVTAAIVYDWCYPVIAAQQKADLIKILIRLAQALECGYPPDKGSFVVGHPSEFMILRDMLSAGIAIYDENPEMYRLAAGRILGTHVPARNWWYPGGAFHQGSGYSDARFVSDMYAAFIFARMGAGNIFDKSQQFVPYEWIYLRRPDPRNWAHCSPPVTITMAASWPTGSRIRWSIPPTSSTIFCGPSPTPSRAVGQPILAAAAFQAAGSRPLNGPTRAILET
jgi:hypothetical protein